jgi:molybdopterin synthase catalytic subunit
VTRLDYQAYSKVAVKTMANIIREARAQASRSEHQVEGYVSSILKCAVYHRLGTVPVGEASIVIAVSSPHRRESFVACEYILEQVKRRAQIWKREFYEGEREEDAAWKENVTTSKTT